MFNSMPAEPAALRGRGRLAPGARAAIAGRENGFSWEGARLTPGGRTALPGSRRPPKTFIAAATNVRSGRYECP